MISVAMLLVALGLSWFLLAGFRTGSLTGLERGYLFLSPLPVILALGVPLALTILRVDSNAAPPLSNGLTVAGIWLSGVLVLAGLALVWRRRGRVEGPAGRMAAGIFLAAIPALLTLLVNLLYLLRS